MASSLASRADIVGARSGRRTVSAPRSGAGAVLVFLLFYMIAFPKAGIKLSDIPITFGYVFSLPVLVIATLRVRGGLTLPVDRLAAYIACLLMTGWSAIFVAFNGVASVGFAVSYFIAVLYLPLFGLTVFSPLILEEFEPRVERAIIWALRLVVVFGLILFVYKYVTGKWIEIPFLTVNAGDVGQLDEKHINRGGVFKLISTYNNGNLFGVSMCIIGPLYLRLERSRVLRGLFYLALLLTLSRTVWLGLVALILIRTLSEPIDIRTILSLLLGALGAVAMVYAMLLLLHSGLNFLLDANLGGRLQQVVSISDAAMLPSLPLSSLPEIVYIGILAYFGYFGVVLFLGMMLIVPVLLAMHGVPVLSTSRASACLQGLLLYVLLGFSDAGFNLIPVVMIFWIVAGLGLWYVRYQRR